MPGHRLLRQPGPAPRGVPRGDPRRRQVHTHRLRGCWTSTCAPAPTAPALAGESLMLADWVKINEDELDCLLGWFEPALPDAHGSLRDCSAWCSRVARPAMRCMANRASCWPAGDGRCATWPSSTASAPATASRRCCWPGGPWAGTWLRPCSLANRYAAMICGVRGPLARRSRRRWPPGVEALHACCRTGAPIEHEQAPSRRSRQIVNMNVGFLGIQFSFGLQQANMSPIYQMLGRRRARTCPTCGWPGPSPACWCSPSSAR